VEIDININSEELWGCLSEKMTGVKEGREHIVSQWQKFYELLVEYNQKVNLTRIVSLQDAIFKHFYDSYILFDYLNKNGIKDWSSMMDFGTGGGVPGIPMKVMVPKSSLYLVDARNKKLGFCKEAATELGYKDVYCVHDNWNPARARKWSKSEGQMIDLIMARAVGETSMLVRTLGPIAKKCLLFPKGPSLEREELRKANNIAHELGFEAKHSEIMEIDFLGMKMERKMLMWVK
jgi:16S rRNA (guanine527-N7)-methyltransferase